MKSIYLLIACTISYSIAFSQTTNYGTYSGISGNSSTFIGYNAGKANTAIRNTFIGHNSGMATTTGKHNAFLGSFTGRFNTTGSFNLFVGNQAGYKNKTGSNNIFLGHKAGYSETGSNKLYIDNTDTTTPLIYGDFNTKQLGINTNQVPPDYALAIKGKVITDEVRVQLTGDWNWPDYVFDQDYELMPLDELKTFIEENKHLPDIPSKAVLVDQGGVDVGNMHQILLKKIEELSLYILDLKEEIEALQSK